MRYLCNKSSNCGKVGMDKFYKSAEWDVAAVYGEKCTGIPA